ncbi:MAG: hypothetical protein QNJ18_15535, partial [Xenococcaceae cyanobacterium MO_167.B52]|nr:hypothetical protein [Xenococcaceae cyanobacterium MO_167.B52]
THIQIFQVRFCTNLQQFLARFLALESIIQLLKPLVYKDFVSKLLAQFVFWVNLCPISYQKEIELAVKRQKEHQQDER